jgi:very-short-patch-repair endonuclease
MRINLDKKHFTKAERKFGRRLQEKHIQFKTKVKIKGREIDFLVGKYAIDIDGHSQDIKKNKMLFEAGYLPIHINNSQLTKKHAKHYTAIFSDRTL